MLNKNLIQQSSKSLHQEYPNSGIVDLTLKKNQYQNKDASPSKSSSIIKNSKKIKNNNDKNQKTQRLFRKEMDLFKSNKQNQFHISNIMEQCLYQKLSSAKKYVLVGGIFVELNNVEHNDLFTDKLHLIKNVLKKADGSVLLNLQTIQPSHQFNSVIHILQSTQNQEDYIVSQQLCKVQSYISRLQKQIYSIRQQYNHTYLEKLLSLRQEYVQQELVKQQQSILNEDDFGLSASHIINLDSILHGNQQVIITNPFIKMFGLSNDDFISYVMRNSYLQLLTLESRRLMLRKTIEILSIDGANQFNCTLNDIEIKLFDDILITCSVHIFINTLQFPTELSLRHSQSDFINSKECISTLKFEITSYHLERIINLRNQQMMRNQLANEQKPYYSDTDDFIIKNFDYYLQSVVFLEKYYNQISQEQTDRRQESSENRCNYKIIKHN